MLKSPQPRLQIDQSAAEAFARNLTRFNAGLSAKEQAILSALLRSAMDPWSRSMLEPPELTPDEAATLDRIASAQGTGE